MKKIAAIFVFCAMAWSSVSAQFEMGIKAGISSFDLASKGIVISNPENGHLELNLHNAEYGVHFGLYTRFNLLGLYVEPAVLFNSNTVTYGLKDLSEDSTISTLRSETYRNVDIPLLVGTKLGFLRLQAGPVAHFHLDSTSDLFSIKGYKQNFEKATYGAQFGVGLDIWKLRLDALYERNLSKFGEHITVGDQQLAFDNAASRIVMTVGLKF